jgi:hypothetical protein
MRVDICIIERCDDKNLSEGGRPFCIERETATSLRASQRTDNSARQ